MASKTEAPALLEDLPCWPSDSETGYDQHLYDDPKRMQREYDDDEDWDHWLDEPPVPVELEFVPTSNTTHP